MVKNKYKKCAILTCCRNPTSKLDEDVNVEWIPQNKNNNYLIVDEKMTMQIGVFQERVNFWIEIFKDYLLDFSF